MAAVFASKWKPHIAGGIQWIEWNYIGDHSQMIGVIACIWLEQPLQLKKTEVLNLEILRKIMT